VKISLETCIGKVRVIRLEEHMFGMGLDIVIIDCR